MVAEDMSNPDNTCPQCGKSALINGDCPLCGFHMPESLRQGDRSARENNRAGLWTWFWLLFLGTPVLGILGVATRAVELVVLLLLAGTIGAGFVLARIFAKDSAMIIVLGIVFSVGVAAIYFGIVFVGCLVMMKGVSF
jgi:hypothetical protein